ncbi:hypothetical protein MtrunA17_Chr7g0228691 [Medicago truncatula]|uniref:Uncharacterized protein n=1 Tax=Medicago truncatula TaxID=3880 RepID=A0A396GVX1_MEDTR|nr:hypothetical protein MtrunA17_Chr7g0228691 [Medicago truncatula]
MCQIHHNQSEKSESITITLKQNLFLSLIHNRIKTEKNSEKEEEHQEHLITKINRSKPDLLRISSNHHKINKSEPDSLKTTANHHINTKTYRIFEQKQHQRRV